MTRIGFISLGCPKNQVDSEWMIGLTREAGWELTNNPEEAEVLIVNTCGFIESAKEESINTILEMAKYKQTSACQALIVAGCLAERYSQDLLDEIPEIDAVMGTGAYRDIVTVIKRVLNKERFTLLPAKGTGIDEPAPRVLTTPNYTAYLKIAEGCDNCCTYCIIPALRGPYISRPIELLLEEASQLVKSGVRELILVAQDTTRYGEDLYGHNRLVELVQRLAELPELVWIRLLYCYPSHFSDELIELMATEPKVCRYIDLPLQHAHNDILQRMNRTDTVENVRLLLEKIRRRMPDVCLRTSLIVGFPGETEEEFAALQAFVAEQRFDRAGIFMYSQEEGTVAAEWENQVPQEIKEERYHQLMAQQALISEEKNRALEGTTFTVLVEGVDDEQDHVVVGRSRREAPDIDGVIYVERAGNARVGEFITVKALQGFTYDVLTERIEG